MPTQPPTPEWAAALGRIPSGLFVLTIRHQQQETAMLISWVQQCSFEPPLITIAIQRERPILQHLMPGAEVVVNILGEGSRHLVAHFGKKPPEGASVFDGVAVERTGLPAPVLAEAHGYLIGRVVAHYDTGGDHLLLVAHVCGGRILHGGRPTVHVRNSGLHY